MEIDKKLIKDMQKAQEDLLKSLDNPEKARVLTEKERELIKKLSK